MVGLRLQIAPLDGVAAAVNRKLDNFGAQQVRRSHSNVQAIVPRVPPAQRFQLPICSLRRSHAQPEQHGSQSAILALRRDSPFQD